MTISTASTSTRNGAMDMVYRTGSSDEIVLAEFEADPYGIAAIEAGERWLDLGANIGLFSVHAGAAGAQVEAFEPDEANYALLQRNVQDVASVRTWPLAVTADGERIRLERPDAQAHWQIKALPDPHGQPSLELRKLITPGCRIKMDVEGAEQRLIIGTPVRAWRQVERLVMEYHLDRLSLADFARAKAHLAAAGLTVSHPPLDAQTLNSYQLLEQPFIVSAVRVKGPERSSGKRRAVSRR
jgi:FkbM family methyltransferase